MNELNVVEELIEWGVDGVITDYPSHIRRHVHHRGESVAPKYPKRRVFDCLK